MMASFACFILHLTYILLRKSQLVFVTKCCKATSLYVVHCFVTDRQWASLRRLYSEIWEFLWLSALKKKTLMLSGSRPVHTRRTARRIPGALQKPGRGGTLPSMIAALNQEHCPLWSNELCQPCHAVAERTGYIEKSLGTWLAHAASPPPLPSPDLHSWHKLLLQCNLCSSTEFDKNSWVFCIFMCLEMCRLLERNQHPSGREAGARGICCKEPERFGKSPPSLPWLSFCSFTKMKHPTKTI